MDREITKKDIAIWVAVGIGVIVTVSMVIFAIDIYNSDNNQPRDPTGSALPAVITFNESPEDEAARLNAEAVKKLGKLKVPKYVEVDYIDPSRARTTKKLVAINNIVVHYIGNPGTTAMQNRNYFDQAETLVCSHFLIGLDGEIIQCIPLDEQSAASNHRNIDTISIEVCHPDNTGRFNEASYDSLVRLVTWLCNNTAMDQNSLIRHHDVTGKHCPKHFVDNPNEWEQFKLDVKNGLKVKPDN